MTLERARKMLFARQDREMKKRIRFLKNNGLLDGISRKEIKNEGNKGEEDQKVCRCEKQETCGEGTQKGCACKNDKEDV